MRKNVIILLLSIVIVSGSMVTIPLYAAETTTQETMNVEEQTEVSETVDTSESAKVIEADAEQSSTISVEAADTATRAEANMQHSESVSIGLGVLSVILALIAIFQAVFYKREQAKEALVQEAFLKEQRINMSYACIRNREIYRRMNRRDEVVLRRDRVVVYATSDLNKEIIKKEWDKIKRTLDTQFKSRSGRYVFEEIEKSALHQGDNICEVNLRNEATANDLRALMQMNEYLANYGIYLSLMIE